MQAQVLYNDGAGRAGRRVPEPDRTTGRTELDRSLLSEETALGGEDRSTVFDIRSILPDVARRMPDNTAGHQILE